MSVQPKIILKITWYKFKLTKQISISSLVTEYFLLFTFAIRSFLLKNWFYYQNNEFELKSLNFLWFYIIRYNYVYLPKQIY